MLEIFINGVVIFFLLCGLILFTGGGIGILRMPDFYSRMHPAGKLDTLGVMFMVIALAIYNINWGHMDLGNILISIKILLISVFIFYASPTATHVIVDAGIQAGMTPWQKDKQERE